jgi:hypothetical protein
MIVNTRVSLRRVRYFFEQSSSKIYWPSDLANVVRERWVEWNIPNTLTTKKFIQEYLLEKLPLRAVKFESDLYPDVFRYVWKESATELELALSLKRSSYFSHATAVWLHQLSRTNAYTKKLYVNHEQRPKQKPDSELSQDAIDNAFGAPQRQSKYAFTAGAINCVVLNGKHSGRLGVSPDRRTYWRVCRCDRSGTNSGGHRRKTYVFGRGCDGLRSLPIRQETPISREVAHYTKDIGLHLPVSPSCWVLS